MTDAELIAQLREGTVLRRAENGPVWGAANPDGDAAAARIEALTKERDEQIEWVKRLADDLISAEAKLATCEKYRDAYDEMGRIGTQAVRDLEAKLAKAVELALEECPFRHGTPKYNDWWHHRRAALAEIKGDSHD